MKIKFLIMDVDGTLTDGKIYMSDNGELFKAFNVKDGLGITRMAKEFGVEPIIITGRQSTIVENRCKELGISRLYQGVEDKYEVLEKIGIDLSEAMYIGDDLNDLDCLHYAGLSACPADSVQAVQTSVDFICTSSGGRGAVREFINMLLRYE